MGNVRAGLSMSLDGYIAGPNDRPDNPLGDGGERLFDWYNNGDTELPLAGTDMVFHVSRASAEFIQPQWQAVGAGVAGRRTFDIAGAWGGNPPGGGPSFVVTHHPPREWMQPGSPFTFVTEGVERAVALARQAAGDKDVDVIAGSIVQQCLKAGLLDQIQIDLVPVLLGGGVRLFGDAQSGGSLPPANFTIERVVEGQGVTHLLYRIKR